MNTNTNIFNTALSSDNQSTTNWLNNLRNNASKLSIVVFNAACADDELQAVAQAALDGSYETAVELITKAVAEVPSVELDDVEESKIKAGFESVRSMRSRAKKQGFQSAANFQSYLCHTICEMSIRQAMGWAYKPSAQSSAVNFNDMSKEELKRKINSLASKVSRLKKQSDQSGLEEAQQALEEARALYNPTKARTVPTTDELKKYINGLSAEERDALLKQIQG